MVPRNLVVAVLLCSGAAWAADKCFIVFHSPDGLHSIPLNGDEDRLLAKLSDSDPTDMTPSSGLAVDGVRNVILWSENENVYRVQQGKPREQILTLSLPKGTWDMKKSVHGMTMQTETHTAYGSIYDDKGGFRVFAFDYTASQPVADFTWCGATRCGVKSEAPTGGAVVAADGKVFVASSCGHRQRAYGTGGAAIRHWDTGVEREKIHQNDAVNKLNLERTTHGFPGEMSSMTIDEEANVIYFVERKGRDSSQLWKTDYAGSYAEVISGIRLPSVRTWTLNKNTDGVPTSHIAALGKGTLAVANRTHIYLLNVDSPQEKPRVVYKHIPRETDKASDAFLSPLAFYCEGVHQGGRPQMLHDEL
ncbi:hypothetical protein DIPPA_22350 [Diplonema papillatum]|nr:hypothetical protein DIPPA_22350 [Diplonema papillatum]